MLIKELLILAVQLIMVIYVHALMGAGLLIETNNQ